MDRFLLWLVEALGLRLFTITGNTRTGGNASTPYMHRWFLWEQRGTIGWRVLIHKMVRPDEDERPHNHPWPWAIAICLSGGYVEERVFDVVSVKHRLRHIRPWSVNLVRGGDFHRICALPNEHSWSLFIHPPRTQHWGFLSFNPVTRCAEVEPFQGGISGDD